MADPPGSEEVPVRTTLRSVAIALASAAAAALVPAPTALAQIEPAPAIDSDGDGVLDSFDALPDDPTLWRPEVVVSDGAVASGAVVVAEWDPVSGAGRLVLFQSWGEVWILPLADDTVVGTSEHSITGVGLALRVGADGSLVVRRAAALLVGSPTVARLVVAVENPTLPAVPQVFTGLVSEGDLTIQNR